MPEQPRQATATFQPDEYLSVEDGCTVCSWCSYTCPVAGCITFETGAAHISQDTCIECGRCIFVCPVNVIVPQREARPRPLREHAK